MPTLSPLGLGAPQLVHLYLRSQQACSIELASSLQLAAGMKGALWSFMAFVLAALPQPLCCLPFVAWALSLAWTVLVFGDHTLPLTRYGQVAGRRRT